MPRHRSIVALFTALLVVVVLAGCGGEEPTPTPTAIPATDTPAPTAPPQPTATPRPSPTPSPIFTPEATVAVDEATLEESRTETPADEAQPFALPAEVLQSFRMRGDLLLVTTFDDGETEEESLRLSGAHVATGEEFGFDQYFEIVAARAGTERSEVVAIYEVGDVVAAYYDGEWRTVTRAGARVSLEDNPFNHPLVRLRSAFAAAEIVDVEILNGVETLHYVINDPQLFIQVTELKMTEGQEIELSQIEVWVATDDQYIVRYEISARVTDALDFDAQGNRVRADQDVIWTYEIYDIGADIPISLPEEAPDPAAFTIPGFLDGEFPVPEGAEVRTNIYGEAEIRADLPEEQVVSFYVDVLSRLGWAIQGDFGLYEVQKEEFSFSLVTAADEQGQTVVRVRKR
jgi:hypothetical protein